MRRVLFLSLLMAGLPALLALTSAPEAVPAVQSDMTFFLTSRGPGDGANLGGLEGADAHCAMLAEEGGAASGLTWRAYLSTIGDAGVNAKDRIGAGPWHNANGVMVASDVTDLHSDNNKLSKENSLTEQGGVVNGRGDTPNEHDILTGTQEDGRAFSNGEDHTCGNWTGHGEGSAQVGHHDRIGGGPNPTSWNASHGSRGCGQDNLQGTGGNGYFYCFAAD